MRRRYTVGGKKNRILIVDDSEMNRRLLTEMLKKDYEIVEVESGLQAVSYLREHAPEVSLVLLDILMPGMDGFQVLAYMNRYHWIDNVPVIMISSDNSSDVVRRAYDFGATDFISRPFNMAVVYRRVANTIMLYAKQRKLEAMLLDQIQERERSNDLMVNILSHIVEFRNGESGQHVLHIKKITEMLLERLDEKTGGDVLTRSDISLISTASALHDIGKISIPEEILNKPGRLTPEEFEVMKQHSAAGASMLSSMGFYQDEPLVKVAYEICRWHHERFDGKGYPDGLKGDDIPVSAQVVSLADVYDALTSERCYKKAFSHEKAMEMILNGECGAFNPLLLECLEELGDKLQKELQSNLPELLNLPDSEELREISDELMQSEEMTETEKAVQMLEFERSKVQFLAASVPEIIANYTHTPPMLSFTEEGAKILGLKEIIIDPLNDPEFREYFGEKELQKFLDDVVAINPRSPEAHAQLYLSIHGEKQKCSCYFKGIWTKSAPISLMGGIGMIQICKE